MNENAMNFASPVMDTRMYDASPNTGRTLAGAANVITQQKKLRKKEDDMKNAPIKRQVIPVTVSAKDAAIGKHDPHQDNYEKNAQPRHDLLTPPMDEDDMYEPYVGVLVDYTI